MKFVRSAFMLCAALALPVALGGCMSMGSTAIEKEDAATLEQKIVRGKTTKAQVLAIFGEPLEKGTRDGREFWAYRTTQTSTRTFVPFAGLVTNSSGITSKDLVVYFDRAGVVQSYDLTEAKS